MTASPANGITPAHPSMSAGRGIRGEGIAGDGSRGVRRSRDTVRLGTCPGPACVQAASASLVPLIRQHSQDDMLSRQELADDQAEGAGRGALVSEVLLDRRISDRDVDERSFEAPDELIIVDGIDGDAAVAASQHALVLGSEA